MNNNAKLRQYLTSSTNNAKTKIRNRKQKVGIIKRNKTFAEIGTKPPLAGIADSTSSWGLVDS